MEAIELSNAEKRVLAQELAQVKNEKEFNAWLERARETAWPALPYDPRYNNQTPIDYTTPTRVTPEWQAVRQWQITELPTQNINYVRQQLKDMWVSDTQIERVVREIEASNAKQWWLFEKVDQWVESEWLNPNAISTKDLNKMDDLNNVTSALEKKNKADYISHRIAEDKWIDRLGTNDEMDRFADISADVENMLDDFDYGWNEAAKIRANRLFPWEDAETIIERYTKRYNSDLKDYNSLKKKYKWYESWKVKLWDTVGFNQKQVTPTISTVTPWMDEAAKRYTSWEWMRINQYLRDPRDFGLLSKTEQWLLDDLDALTRSDTVKQKKLYRATSADWLLWRMNEDTWDDLLNSVYWWETTTKVSDIINNSKGKVLEEKWFLSTTTDKTIADEWGWFTDWRHEVTLELEVPEWVKWKDLSNYDLPDNPQKEVLLAQWTKYEIIDILPNEWEWWLLIRARIRK